MIFYNMRERGPYEYDKFVLNILQLYNSINLIELEELQNVSEMTSSLLAINKELNNKLTNLDIISDNLNKKLLTLKEFN